ELCRALRSRSADLPIIFLTARDSEFDAVSGLRLGADDYLTKDISLPHLMARVAALFRRLDVMKNPQSDENRLNRGSLELDIDRMTVRWKDQPVGLTLTEFWMVHALARYPGHVKNRQQLMDAAQAVLDDNTITSHVKRIRRKFVALDAGFESIETVYGMGYRWLTEAD
ncbi:MAG: winged helix-turn-helix domain-containing protein, partial [Woeseiaceae bacterium]